MSTSIIPFDSGKLPAYFTQTHAAANTDDLTSHAGLGFPVISIKGKNFTVVRDGDRTLVRNPKDETAAAHYIDVIIVKANKNNSKIYYAKPYVEGSDDKPDCYSNDGITPAAEVDEPQAKKCAVCKFNQWGSRISNDGRKGKACQDSARLAVSMVSQPNDPYLLRVPPASLKSLAELGNVLKKRGVPNYQMVVTRITMEAEAATPKLVFTPIGFVPDEVYREVNAVAGTDVVQMIVGTTMLLDLDSVVAAPPPSAGKVVTDQDVAVAVAAATTSKAATVVDPDVEIDLDKLNFDD